METKLLCGLSKGLFLNLIFQKKIPFWLFKDICLPMCSQNQQPNVFSSYLVPTLIDVFPPAFIKPEKFTIRKMYVLSLKRLGKGAQNGGKPSLPPYQSLHWIFFWPGGGSLFLLGALSFIFSLETSKLSSQKIAICPGNCRSTVTLQGV